MRTTLRYRFITENLIRNASLGIFPVEYQEIGQKNLAINRSKASEGAEKKISGRKRIARPKGYVKAQKLVDQDNPNRRKMYVK